MVRMARSSKDDEPVVERGEHDAAPNPVWFKPLMIGFMLLGLVWVIVFYLTNQQYPIPGITGWNLVIGFGIAFIGFLMTTRWR
jgi:hypothetical protein